jgi:hypothetical protein
MLILSALSLEAPTLIFFMPFDAAMSTSPLIPRRLWITVALLALGGSRIVTRFAHMFENTPIPKPASSRSFERTTNALLLLVGAL